MMFQIVSMLKLLNHSLKELNKQVSSSIVTEANEDREALEKLPKALQAVLGDLTLQQMEKVKYQQFKRSSYLAEFFLQQRSKATWNTKHDNTKHVFSVIKHRRLQKAITQLHDKHNVLQTDPEAIAHTMVDYYQELLRRKSAHRVKAFNSFLSNGVQLTSLQQLALVQQYTNKDVKNKSPGPDGYETDFFRAAWNTLAKDFTQIVFDFFQNGSLLKEIYVLMISLIPKVPIRQNPNQYHVVMWSIRLQADTLGFCS